MARDLGINRNTVIAWTGKSDFPGGLNGPWLLADVVPWILARQSHRESVDDDPAMDGGDSPGLERYRQSKAALAALELEERKKGLLSIDKAKSVLIRWAMIVRNLGERLGKRFGNDAANSVNDALAECQGVIDYELGPSEPSDECAA